MRDYWQKRPLLVRQALPGFIRSIPTPDLLALAGRDEVESRLIVRGRGARGWRVTPGPLAKGLFAKLPLRDWTVLVNGVNMHSVATDALLQRFAFLSWARLDDVMVSYAAAGGGVGPHFDSYDVFLLQGSGSRRWRLMPPPPAPRTFHLLTNMPLKLIADFRPTVEWVLEPGDMLYLPPGWGHDGTAEGACTTYSIGFRAPRGAELAAAFLDYLHERGFADSAYADPGRHAATHPARIDASMIDYAADSLGRIRWGRADVARFLGAYLSEPKTQVFFDPPARPLGRIAFMRALARAQVLLDRRTRLLSHGAHFFINGEPLVADSKARPALLKLADSRRIEGRLLARAGTGDLVFDWYRQGYLSLHSAP